MHARIRTLNMYAAPKQARLWGYSSEQDSFQVPRELTGWLRRQVISQVVKIRSDQLCNRSMSKNTLMGQTTVCPLPPLEVLQSRQGPLSWLQGKWFAVPGSKSETATNFPEVDYCKIPFLAQILLHLKPSHVPCVHQPKSNGIDRGFLIPQYGNIR